MKIEEVEIDTIYSCGDGKYVFYVIFKKIENKGNFKWTEFDTLWENKK